MSQLILIGWLNRYVLPLNTGVRILDLYLNLKSQTRSHLFICFCTEESYQNLCSIVQ